MTETNVKLLIKVMAISKSASSLEDLEDAIRQVVIENGYSPIITRVTKTIKYTDEPETEED